MANSNGLITAPVSFGDVNTVLGTSYTSLSSLCTSNNINIMSKYKPVPYNGDNMSQWDSSNNTWSSSATWYKGNGNNYGLSMFNTTTFSDIINRTSGGTNGWGLSHPSGGSSQPYRLQDFASYSHGDGRYYITSPTSALTSSTVPVTLGGQGTYGLSINSLLSSRYFGAAIVNASTTNTLKFKTATSTSSTSVSFSSAVFGYTGTFRIFPFFSSQIITEGSTIPSGTIFYTIPYANSNNILVTGSTPSQSAKISVTGVNGVSSPALSFLDDSNHALGGMGRVSGSQVISCVWTPGTVTRVQYSENGGHLKYMEIKGYNGVTLLPKTAIDMYDTIIMDSFSATDYGNNSRTLYVTFSNTTSIRRALLRFLHLSSNSIASTLGQPSTIKARIES